MFYRVDQAVELISMEGSKENPLNGKDNSEDFVNLELEQKINKKEKSEFCELDLSKQAPDYSEGNRSNQKIDCSDIEEEGNKNELNSYFNAI